MQRNVSKRHAKADFTIALLGQPNSGKSTLFNGLTGARQHVGNWPGKTVERKSGAFSRDGHTFEVVDLPGAYGLDAASPEEEVTRDFIASGEADTVVVFADASQLERSLYMLACFAGSKTPAILALNLMDVAESQDKTIDTSLLEERLGIPVLPLVATEHKSYPALYEAIDQSLKGTETNVVTAELSLGRHTWSRRRIAPRPGRRPIPLGRFAGGWCRHTTRGGGTSLSLRSYRHRVALVQTSGPSDDLHRVHARFHPGLSHHGYWRSSIYTGKGSGGLAHGRGST